MKKLIFTATIASSLLFLSVTTSFAQSPTVAGVPGDSGADAQNMMMQKRDQVRQNVQEKVAGTLQDRAEAEISRRITSLEKLITRINSFKRLSESQKTALTTQVQTEIDALKALQEKISTTTDASALKTEVKTIITSHRIYAFFMPKIAVLSTAERILTVTEQMEVVSGKLETRIAEAETAGQDVSEWEASLSQMDAKIADAQKQSEDVIALVIPLTVDGYPENKTTLVNARTLLKTAMTDLMAAKKLSKSIMQELKSSTSAATITVSPTPDALSPTDGL